MAVPLRIHWENEVVSIDENGYRQIINWLDERPPLPRPVWDDWGICYYKIGMYWSIQADEAIVDINATGEITCWGVEKGRVFEKEIAPSLVPQLLRDSRDENNHIYIGDLLL